MVTNAAVNPSPYMYDKSYSGQTGPLPTQTSQLQGNKENSIELLKGQMIGRFEMGSTIVLVWECSEGAEI